jgi:trk system potassium uptake protein
MVRHIQLGPGFSFAEITLPESLAGKTLGQSRIREDYHLNVVALKKKKPAITPDGERTFEEFIDNVPEPGEPLTEGTILILAGKDDDLVRFAEE